ncbi:MAG TPA: hypothetical protein VNW29_07615, partial [Candidatus Sulfotelmatobacter sp.]|nr:hypothetical protein [Candidatus Sulfotelmatobacter sp.]
MFGNIFKKDQDNNAQPTAQASVPQTNAGVPLQTGTSALPQNIGQASSVQNSPIPAPSVFSSAPVAPDIQATSSNPSGEQQMNPVTDQPVET